MPSNASGELENIGQCDHSATNEYLIFGPPGSGKTRSLERQVALAAKKYGPDRILVTSFSRAAATELTDRALPIFTNQIGTLHAHSWRALGRPRIAEAHVAEWNRENRGFQITPVRKQNTALEGEAGEEEGADEAKRGDVLLQSLNRYRGLMAPQDLWPPEVREFGVKWESYKRANSLVDFCDLIEIATHDLSSAPGGISVLIADEVQDLNPMQSQLIRQWGSNTEYFVGAGDDDQTIYAFAGATPETMLNPELPDDHKIILTQSHRLPFAVREFADQLIHRVSRRQEKVYAARPERGAFLRIGTGYKCPEYGILASALEHLSRGKTIMLLASCSYMLQPLIQVLRKNAIPFHNPYRRSAGFWNPLRMESRGSAANRIRALLSACPSSSRERTGWSYADLQLIAGWLTGTGTLIGDALQTAVKGVAKENLPIEYLASVFEPPALTSLLTAMDGDGPALFNWWRSRVHPDFHRRIQFLTDIAIRRGLQAVIETPRVIVGTIHSVKGGQADVVYLFPDLSRAGDASYRIPGASRDSVTRLFYVGVTRAREILYICGRETGRAVVL